MIVERKKSVEVLLAFRAYLSLSATVAAAVARSFEGLGRRFTQLPQAVSHAFPVLWFLANGYYAVCSLKENSISITRAERDRLVSQWLSCSPRTRYARLVRMNNQCKHWSSYHLRGERDCARWWLNREVIMGSDVKHNSVNEYWLTEYITDKIYNI